LLNLVVPNGSLEPLTTKLFEEADLPIRKASERSYNAAIRDPRFAKVKFLRPPEIPGAVADGHFDLGIVGTHSILEAGVSVIEAMDLGAGGRTGGSPRVVLAAPGSSGFASVEQLPQGVRIASEWPELTRAYLAERGVEAHVFFSHGATEAKIPELAEAIVDITETGSSLRAAGFVILAELHASKLKLIANEAAWADPVRRGEIEEIMTLLGGVLQARGKVLLKMNVPAARLDELIGILPAMKAPTVSKLFSADYYAIETVAVKAEVNLLIPKLKKHGAEDILELPISKIVA
jgi:ATP phosphoribosyltransferase